MLKYTREYKMDFFLLYLNFGGYLDKKIIRVVLILIKSVIDENRFLKKKTCSSFFFIYLRIINFKIIR